MKRLGLSLGVLFGLASTSLLISAQNGPSVTAPSPTPAAAATTAGPADARQVFQKYCFECHGTYKPEAGLSIERLLAQGELGPQSEHWEKIADAIETEVMPPVEAFEFPTDAERTAAANWVRGALNAYAETHAGDPGRVTVRRLTSAEYAYAIEDLTGIPIKVGIDASSDSVGGEGFTNFGDVQFVQDASIERYLEAAKQVANHAVIGSGPMEFFSDPGRTGLELSALARINELYSTRGFRVVSGEGGRPFGLERYGKAFFVAWQFKHRAALGMPRATVRDLAAKEGITGRFADHVWSVVNRTNLGYPSREMVDRWKALPAPTSDVAASLEAARAPTVSPSTSPPGQAGSSRAATSPRAAPETRARSRSTTKRSG
jgi:mono/diheme cytochrome c family protein